MRVRVHLFARYREVAGKEQVDLDLPEGGTVETAWKAIVTLHPQLEQYRAFTLFAVGHDYVEPDHTLKPGDELLLFPPVSGGSSDDVFAVVDRPLSPDDIAARVDDAGAGGVVIFSGVVRNETGGRPVKFLEYEAHAPMAEAKMREIGAAIRARWAGVKRVAMLHRIGRLEIYAIDTLKRTVPVWKKEHFEDGEVWVGLQGG